MGLFSDFVGSDFKHASFAVDYNNAVGSPRTPATTQQDGVDSFKRTSRLQLEQLYLRDAQTFNTINIYKQLLLQTGYKIVADNKTNQKQYDTFFEEMGKVGMNVKLEQLLDRIIHDVTLYGYAYVEKVFQGNRIVDLKPIDAKLMDYARNAENQIVVNEAQNPVGYIFKVGVGHGDKPVKGINGDVSLNHGEWFIDAERIACFILYPYGNGFESLGLIEAAYEDILRKIKIKTAIANNIHNSAASHLVATVGDGQQKASQKLMEGTLDALKNLSYNRLAVFAHPTQVQSIDVQHSPQADEFMRVLRSEQSAASGLALGFAVGSGEAVNRQTLTDQRKFTDMRMDSIAYSITEQFTSKILDALYKHNKYGSRAKMFWNEISTVDKLEMTNSMMNAINGGVLSPEEVRAYVLQAFNLEADEASYNKMKKDKEKAKKESLNVQQVGKVIPKKDKEKDTTDEE